MSVSARSPADENLAIDVSRRSACAILGLGAMLKISAIEFTSNRSPIRPLPTRSCLPSHFRRSCSTFSVPALYRRTLITCRRST
jgi:hypothetical protein